MAKNLVFAWTFQPIDPLKHLPLKEVMLRVRLVKNPPGTWTTLRVPVPELTARIENLPPGAYEAEAYTVDVADQLTDTPRTGQQTIPADKPLPLATFTFTVE